MLATRGWALLKDVYWLETRALLWDSYYSINRERPIVWRLRNLDIHVR
jgi:hypothetical protein